MNKANHCVNFWCSGIRILNNELTDALKAKGLGFRQDYVDIYSNSWGPDNYGPGVAEIGVMTEKVIRKGAMEVFSVTCIFQVARADRERK